MEVTPEWGKFDYIIAHGVFSWVPHEVAEKVLQICGEQLTPNGVAYVSFNTYPGWHMRMWARDAMRFHAGIRRPDPEGPCGTRLHPGTGERPASALLKGEVKYLQGKPESYVLHEYLESTNHPFYFRDFAARIARHGLQYLGDALQNGLVGGGELGAVPQLDGGESR